MSETVNIEVLAACFAGVLRGWLSNPEWSEMRALNTPSSTDAGCASHDFCDANMAMDAAWVIVLGRHLDVSSDADKVIWSDAWTLAQANYLSGAETHRCDWCYEAVA